MSTRGASWREGALALPANASAQDKAWLAQCEKAGYCAPSAAREKAEGKTADHVVLKNRQIARQLAFEQSKSESFKVFWFSFFASLGVWFAAGHFALRSARTDERGILLIEKKIRPISRPRRPVARKGATDDGGEGRPSDRHKKRSGKNAGQKKSAGAVKISVKWKNRGLRAHAGSQFKKREQK